MKPTITQATFAADTPPDGKQRKRRQLFRRHNKRGIAFGRTEFIYLGLFIVVITGIGVLLLNTVFATRDDSQDILAQQAVDNVVAEIQKTHERDRGLSNAPIATTFGQICNTLRSKPDLNVVSLQLGAGAAAAGDATWDIAGLRLGVSTLTDLQCPTTDANFQIAVGATPAAGNANFVIGDTFTAGTVLNTGNIASQERFSQEGDVVWISTPAKDAVVEATPVGTLGTTILVGAVSASGNSFCAHIEPNQANSSGVTVTRLSGSVDRFAACAISTSALLVSAGGTTDGNWVSG